MSQERLRKYYDCGPSDSSRIGSNHSSCQLRDFESVFLTADLSSWLSNMDTDIHAEIRRRPRRNPFSDLEMPEDEATRAAEDLVRAYDPCISCATHFLKLKVEEAE